MKQHHSYFTWRRYIRSIALIIAVLVIVISVACSNYSAKAVPPTHLAQTDGPHHGSDQQEKETSHQEDAVNEQTGNQQGTGTAISPTTSNGQNPALSGANDPASTDSQLGKRITAIGDSVILDAAPFLNKMLPGIVVDGKVGRQMWQAQDVIDLLKEQGKLGDIIIIELGTNGSFNTKQLRKLLQSLGDDKQIFLVNTRVPKKWQDTVNKDIEEVSSDFSNTMVVDWYSASEEKDDYFTPDGVHLKREGAEYYASILAKAVKGKET